jgi:hypothetical protein
MMPRCKYYAPVDKIFPFYQDTCNFCYLSVALQQHCDPISISQHQSRYSRYAKHKSYKMTQLVGIDETTCWGDAGVASQYNCTSAQINTTVPLQTTLNYLRDSIFLKPAIAVVASFTIASSLGG